MYDSLQRIAALPEDTRLYCAHEYTLANGRFAAHAEPGNCGHRGAAGESREDAREWRNHAAHDRRGGTGHQPLRSL
jgi:glyoxylase-like metal-dependent hydrolase (beta-lactamase superfamily II)